MHVTYRRSVRISVAALALMATVIARPWTLIAQGPEPVKGVRFVQINPNELKVWLTDLASDAFQGRQAFTEGYGMASAYVAEHLKAFGVKPMGDNGSYFQIVARKGYRITRNSSVTVDVNGTSRTFKHGDHVTFTGNGGKNQKLTFDGVELVGTAPNYDSKSIKGKLAVWLNPAVVPGAGGAPAAPPGRGGGRGGPNRAALAVAAGASATAGFVAAPVASPAETALAQAQAALAQAAEAVTAAQAQLAGRGGGRAGGGGAGRGGAAVQADLTTTIPPDTALVPPQFTADETFFDFLLSGNGVKFAELRARADKGETVPWVAIPSAKVTIDVNNTYDVVSAEYSRNVVGMVEGTRSEAQGHLRPVRRASRSRRRPPDRRRPTAEAGGAGAGAAPPPGPVDLISNGADDDGSGSTAMLGIAKAFANGPKPKRSMIFVWHTAEEQGLVGARYMAEFPVVPLEKIQVQLNMDMIGRTQDDKPEYENSVFVVGADRISTDLHNLVVLANRAQPKPLTLDYELNSPGEVSIPGMQNIYGRSDHCRLRGEGDPDRVLLHRAARRLPSGERPRGENQLPEAGPRRPAGLRGGVCGRGVRPGPGAGQQGSPGGERVPSRSYQEIGVLQRHALVTPESATS